MNLGLKNKMAFQGTVVSNAFIDTYMTAANGEYVKVFLYLLRHDGEEVTVSAIADALDHTEADVKRALAYWEEAGLLEREGDGDRPEPRQSAEKEAAAEVLLQAKGFSEAVVSINGDAVDVVVNAAELTDVQRAQIEDIVKRKTDIAAENIVISTIAQ